MKSFLPLGLKEADDPYFGVQDNFDTLLDFTPNVNSVCIGNRFSVSSTETNVTFSIHNKEAVRTDQQTALNIEMPLDISHFPIANKQVVICPTKNDLANVLETSLNVNDCPEGLSVFVVAAPNMSRFNANISSKAMKLGKITKKGAGLVIKVQFTSSLRSQRSIGVRQEGFRIILKVIIVLGGYMSQVYTGIDDFRFRSGGKVYAHKRNDTPSASSASQSTPPTSPSQPVFVSDPNFGTVVHSPTTMPSPVHSPMSIHTIKTESIVNSIQPTYCYAFEVLQNWNKEKWFLVQGDNLPTPMDVVFRPLDQADYFTRSQQVPPEQAISPSIPQYLVCPLSNVVGATNFDLAGDYVVGVEFYSAARQLPATQQFTYKAGRLYYANLQGYAVDTPDMGGTTFNMQEVEPENHWVNFFQSNGISTTKVDGHGRTVLHYAALLGYSNVVFMALAKKVDVNVQDVYGCTALHLATFGGHVDATILLLQNGADISLRDDAGQTPLHIAMKWRKFYLIPKLIGGLSFNVLKHNTNAQEVLNLLQQCKNKWISWQPCVLPFLSAPIIKTCLIIKHIINFYPNLIKYNAGNDTYKFQVTDELLQVVRQVFDMPPEPVVSKPPVKVQNPSTFPGIPMRTGASLDSKMAALSAYTKSYKSFDLVASQSTKADTPKRPKARESLQSSSSSLNAQNPSKARPPEERIIDASSSPSVKLSRSSLEGLGGMELPVYGLARAAMTASPAGDTELKETPPPEGFGMSKDKTIIHALADDDDDGEEDSSTDSFGMYGEEVDAIDDEKDLEKHTGKIPTSLTISYADSDSDSEVSSVEQRQQSRTASISSEASYSYETPTTYNFEQQPKMTAAAAAAAAPMTQGSMPQSMTSYTRMLPPVSQMSHSDAQYGVSYKPKGEQAQAKPKRRSEKPKKRRASLVRLQTIGSSESVDVDTAKAKPASPKGSAEKPKKGSWFSGLMKSGRKSADETSAKKAAVKVASSSDDDMPALMSKLSLSQKKKKSKNR